MSLKPGIKVRVKKDLHYTRERRLLVSEMKKFAGTIQIIQSISASEIYPGIYLKGFLFDERDVSSLIERKSIKPELFDLENLDI